MREARRLTRPTEGWRQDWGDRLNWGRCRLRYGRLLPTFVIIGAQKAATTSLHHYLGKHPEIFMGSFKESNLFLADTLERGPYHELEPFFYGASNREKRRGLSDAQILRRKFRGYRGERVIGDASPYYTCAPSSGVETPELIFKAKPEMRLVYVLRNPLARIVSNYNHDAQLHEAIGQGFSDDFNTRVRSRPHFLEISLYFKQLERYLAFFPREQIHVLLYEDLVKSPDATLAELLRFLQCDDRFKFDTTVVHNTRRNERNREPRKERVFSRDLFAELIEPIRRDVSAMEDFLGHSLGEWDLSEERWCQD